ncbi:MAG: hypothetical protein CBB71_06325 [Rhodopirellula sp. TMED11]|nr:MAG: hypothetical protein CBB71_06325 [Rhodopirellula sp. TMED11]
MIFFGVKIYSVRKNAANPKLSKTFVVCEKIFTWGKKWRRNWDEVR